MRHLALGWAEDGVEDLEKFDFIFHVALKDVPKNKTIEQIIIEQHKGLCGNNAKPDEIKAILDGHGDQKVLILLDGHDEFKRSNKDINEALRKSTLRNCWIVVTSRETKHLAVIRECCDAEAQIVGFNSGSVLKYIKKYLGSQRARDFLKLVVRSKLVGNDDSDDENKNVDNFTFPDTDDDDSEDDYDDDTEFGILTIPILLHMLCVLFLRKVSLPKTKTGIISAIVERCPDWEEIRKTGQKKVKAVESALLKLGELALKCLQRDDFEQVFDKVP